MGYLGDKVFEVVEDIGAELESGHVSENRPGHMGINQTQDKPNPGKQMSWATKKVECSESRRTIEAKGPSPRPSAPNCSTTKSNNPHDTIPTTPKRRALTLLSAVWIKQVGLT
jgi:hypothetical protein